MAVAWRRRVSYWSSFLTLVKTVLTSSGGNRTSSSTLWTSPLRSEKTLTKSYFSFADCLLRNTAECFAKYFRQRTRWDVSPLQSYAISHPPPVRGTHWKETFYAFSISLKSTIDLDCNCQAILSQVSQTCLETLLASYTYQIPKGGWEGWVPHQTYLTCRHPPPACLVF